MGINSGLGSISGQEETGAAYILVPSTVSVTLIPLNGSPAAESGNGGYPEVSSAIDSQPLPADQDISSTDVLKAGIEAGAAGLSESKPVEKNWQTSSSSNSYVQPDGTQVTKKSSTSAGVSINPAGILKSLDTLFN